MLVLSRKVGERLVIGGNITVVVNRVAGNRVTLGIEAPDTVRIVRGELEGFNNQFVPLPASKEPHAEVGPRKLVSNLESERPQLGLAK